MATYVKAADAIRDTFNCAIVIVHHCGHEGTRPRGHSSLMGALDAQIAVKRDTADNIIATVELMKDGSQGDEFASRLEVVEVGMDDDVIGDATRWKGIFSALSGSRASRKASMRFFECCAAFQSAINN